MYLLNINNREVLAYTFCLITTRTQFQIGLHKQTNVRILNMFLGKVCPRLKILVQWFSGMDVFKEFIAIKCLPPGYFESFGTPIFVHLQSKFVY